MRNATLLILALFSAHVALADRLIGNAVMLAQDGSTIPSNTVATPAQVAALSNGTAAVSASALTLEEQAASLAASSAELAGRVQLFSSNYVVKSVCWVEGVGAVNFDPSNQTLRITGFSVGATTLSIVGVAKVAPLGNAIPALEWRATLGASGAWTNLSTTGAVETDLPAGYETYAKAWIYEIPKPAGASALFRLIDNSTGISGSGWYWLVYGDIIVNQNGVYYRGRNSVTTNICDNVTNVTRHVSGLDVELEPLGGL